LAQIREAIEKLGRYPADRYGLRLEDWGNSLPHLRSSWGPRGGGKHGRYALERIGEATEEERAEVYKGYEGKAAARTCATMTLSQWPVWRYTFRYSWQLDSMIRLLETGVEPTGTVTVKRGQPAVIEEDNA